MPVYRLQVRLRFPSGSGGGTNSWHFQPDELVSDEPDVQAFANAVSTFYQGCNAVWAQGTTATWDGSVTQVDAGQPILLTGLTPWSRSLGAASGGSGPAPAMACVSWRSQVATRRGRGRTFLGPLAPTALQTDGTLAPDALTSIRTAATALVTTSNSTGTSSRFVVWSELDQTARRVLVATVTDQVAILRSRR